MIQLNDRTSLRSYDLAEYAATEPREHHLYDAFKAAIAEVWRRDTGCSTVRGAPAG